MILVSLDFEDIYVLATVSSLDRELSDHAPLFLNSGMKPKKDHSLTFKSPWLGRD